MAVTQHTHTMILLILIVALQTDPPRSLVRYGSLGLEFRCSDHLGLHKNDAKNAYTPFLGGEGRRQLTVV